MTSSNAHALASSQKSPSLIDPTSKRWSTIKRSLSLQCRIFLLLYDHTRNDYKNLQRKNLCWEQVEDGLEVGTVIINSLLGC